MSTAASARSDRWAAAAVHRRQVHALPAAAMECFDEHGLTTLTELAGVDVDRYAVRRWRQRGLVDGPLPGVVRDLTRPASPLQGLALPLRYLDDGRKAGTRPAVLSGATSLALQGIEGFRVPTRPLVLVEPGRRVRLKGRSWQVREAPQVAGVEHHGVRISVASRGLADAALDRGVTEKALRVGFDDARGRRLLRHCDAVAEWSDGRTHAGTRRLLGIERSGALQHDSEGERTAWRRLFLPFPVRPRCQVWVLPHVRVDFLFEPAALVVEYLGAQHAGQLEADSSRTLQILSAGYELIPVTAGMVAASTWTAARIHRIRELRERLVSAGALAIPALPPQPPR